MRCVPSLPALVSPHAYLYWSRSAAYADNRSLVTYEDSLRERGIPYLDRKAENYPYRSHAQPLIAYLALAGCTFVLLGANQASLWNGFYVEPFLSSFLAVSKPKVPVYYTPYQ